ncbi:MAG: hypothetical protein GY862_27105 [Gammaproteobacteria bacterium]|nr:hypothetical protein [Gammaproteobacteria bacterium]MCP5013866.1 hypothetical protein [Ketobacter sp.]
MKTITIEVPADIPAITLIKGLAAMGLGIKWVGQNSVKGVHCKSCNDTGFRKVQHMSVICNCRQVSGGQGGAA